MSAVGKWITVAITSGVGLIVLAGFFVRNSALGTVQATFLDWTMILAAIALLLGVLNVFGTHVGKIWRGREGWPYSIVLLAALIAVVVLGVAGSPVGVASAPVQWIFRNIQAPLQATLFALLAFFAASAAYRALRIRSWQSLILVVVAVIVLLGQLPSAASLWSGLPKLKEWVLSVPGTAGARGILLGVGLGAVATGLRVLLGADRPHVR